MADPCDGEKPYASSPLPIDGLSTFVETYPTPLHYSQPESDGELFVFWSHADRSQNNPSSGDPGLVSHSPNPRDVRQTITSVFLELQRYHLDVFIQFWSPVKTGCLTTYDQPFALKHLDSKRQKYRLCSLKYQFNINANKPEIKDDPFIISGLPANAFLNHKAEVVLDLRVHHESPLVQSALDCGFMSYFVMPICHPFQCCCVGVVECYANNHNELLEIFTGLARELKAVGLSTFHGQEYRPYATLGGLKNTMDEVEKVLKKICGGYGVTLAQVSIAYEDGNLVPSSSSLEDTHMKPMLALKLVAPFFDEDGDKLDYIDHCGSSDMLPLKIGKGLVGMALKNYEPHFCRKIYETTDDDQLPITESTCLVICLRSNDTDNLDYVFEFLWLQNRDCLTIIEAIVYTLKFWLPKFKFASGAELRDELRVIDGVGIQDLIIFEREKRKEENGKTDEITSSSKDIEQPFGRTQKEAAKNPHVSSSTLKCKCRKRPVPWQRPKSVKKKANTYKDQSYMNQEHSRAIIYPFAVNQEHSPCMVTIKAESDDHIIKFHLPLSLTTLEAVQKEICKKLNLTPRSFKLKYCDEDEDMILLVSNEDVSDWIKSSTIISHVPLKVCAKIYVEYIIV